MRRVDFVAMAVAAEITPLAHGETLAGLQAHVDRTEEWASHEAMYGGRVEFYAALVERDRAQARLTAGMLEAETWATDREDSGPESGVRCPICRADRPTTDGKAEKCPTCGWDAWEDNAPESGGWGDWEPGRTP